MTDRQRKKTFNSESYRLLCQLPLLPSGKTALQRPQCGKIWFAVQTVDICFMKELIFSVATWFAMSHRWSRMLRDGCVSVFHITAFHITALTGCRWGQWGKRWASGAPSWLTKAHAAWSIFWVNCLFRAVFCHHSIYFIVWFVTLTQFVHTCMSICLLVLSIIVQIVFFFFVTTIFSMCTVLHEPRTIQLVCTTNYVDLYWPICIFFF